MGFHFIATIYSLWMWFLLCSIKSDFKIQFTRWSFNLVFHFALCLLNLSRNYHANSTYRIKLNLRGHFLSGLMNHLQKDCFGSYLKCLGGQLVLWYFTLILYFASFNLALLQKNFVSFRYSFFYLCNCLDLNLKVCSWLALQAAKEPHSCCL